MEKCDKFEMKIDDFYINHQNQRLEISWDMCNEELVNISLFYGTSLMGHISLRPEDLSRNLNCLMETKFKKVRCLNGH